MPHLPPCFVIFPQICITPPPGDVCVPAAIFVLLARLLTFLICIHFLPLGRGERGMDRWREADASFATLVAAAAAAKMRVVIRGRF